MEIAPARLCGRPRRAFKMRLCLISAERLGTFRPAVAFGWTNCTIILSVSGLSGKWGMFYCRELGVKERCRRSRHFIPTSGGSLWVAHHPNMYCSGVSPPASAASIKARVLLLRAPFGRPRALPVTPGCRLNCLQRPSRSSPARKMRCYALVRQVDDRGVCSVAGRRDATHGKH
jgi:hypothetical protein